MLRASGKAASLVQQYYKGEINGPHFIEGLFNSGLGDVGKQYAGAMMDASQGAQSRFWTDG